MAEPFLIHPLEQIVNVHWGEEEKPWCLNRLGFFLVDALTLELDITWGDCTGGCNNYDFNIFEGHSQTAIDHDISVTIPLQFELQSDARDFTPDERGGLQNLINQLTSDYYAGGSGTSGHSKSGSFNCEPSTDRPLDNVNLE